MTSTNYTSLSYVEESTPGTTPTSPTFDTLPTTGGSPKSNITTATSEVIRNDRMTDDLIVVDNEISGDLNYELSYAPYKPLVQALLRGTARTIAISATDIAADNGGSQFTSTSTDFTTENIQVGDYIAVDGFTDTSNNQNYLVTSVAANALGVSPAPNDESAGDTITMDAEIMRNGAQAMKTYTFRKEVGGITNTAYFYYRGCAINTMTFNFATGSILTGTLSVIGRTEEATETPISGETVNDTPAYSIMNSVNNVVGINITGLSATTCFETLDLTITNNTTAAKCIGTLGAAGLSDFTNEVTANINLYFEDLIAYNKFLNSQSFSVAIQLEDGDGNKLIVYMPKCKFETLDVPIDGKDSFLMLPGSLRALRDSTTDMQVQFSFVAA